MQPRHGFELARALYRQGDNAGAAKVIEASLRASPDAVDLHELYGDVLASDERSKEAAAAYEQVVTLDPDRSRAWRRLGELRLQSGETAGAIVALERAAVLQPHEPGVFILIAEAGEAAGDSGVVLHALARALQNGEETPRVLQRAGILGAERALLGGEPNFAVLSIEWLERAVELDPQLGLAWQWLGRLRRHRLEPVAAIASLRRAVELDPSDPLRLTELAELYLAQHEDEQAAELVERALALEPDPELRTRLEGLVTDPPASGDPGMTGEKGSNESS